MLVVTSSYRGTYVLHIFSHTLVRRTGVEVILRARTCMSRVLRTLIFEISHLIASCLILYVRI